MSALAILFKKRRRVYDQFIDKVTEDSQGNLYVQVDLPNNEILYSYVMFFSDSVEIIEPQSTVFSTCICFSILVDTKSCVKVSDSILSSFILVNLKKR